MKKGIHKLLFSILVIGIVMLGGCAQQEEPKTTDKVTPQEPSTVDVDKTQTEPSKPTKTGISSDIKKLIDKANGLDNYKYIGYDTKNDVYVQGSKLRIDLFQKVGRTGTTEINTIYLDRDDKSAFGACVGSACDLNTRLIYRKVSYGNYIITTPLEYLNSLVYAKENEGKSKKVGNFQLMNAEFVDEDGKEGEIWINQFWGLPHQIDYFDEEGKITKTIKFDEMVFLVPRIDVNLASDLTLVE